MDFTDPWGESWTWWDSTKANVRQGINLYTDFQKGCLKDTAAMGVNLLTLGGYGGYMKAQQEGKLDEAGLSGLYAYGRGVRNFATLGYYDAKNKVQHTKELTGVADFGRIRGHLKEGSYIEAVGDVLIGSGKVAGLMLGVEGAVSTVGKVATIARAEGTAGVLRAGADVVLDQVPSVKNVATDVKNALVKTEGRISPAVEAGNATAPAAIEIPAGAPAQVPPNAPPPPRSAFAETIEQSNAVQEQVAAGNTAGAGRGNQSAFASKAEDLVSADTGVPRNLQGPGQQTIPGTGPGGFRVPDLKVRGPQGSVRLRGSVMEVKASRGSTFGDLSARSRQQLLDAVSFARRLRAKSSLVKDPQIRSLLEDARVEVFSDLPAPSSGKFADLVEEGLIEWKGIPR